MLPTQPPGPPVRPSPAPSSSFLHQQQPTPPQATAAPTNADIEAIIQMATSNARANPAPPRDTRTQLFVGNLPYRVRWQDLKDLFRKAGTVLRADVSLGPDNRSRGFGTVLLATAEDAGRAIDMFNGYSWQTRILEVRQDRNPPDSLYDTLSNSTSTTTSYGLPPPLPHSASYHSQAQLPQPPPLTTSVSHPLLSDTAAALLGNVGLSSSVSLGGISTAAAAASGLLGPSSPTQSSVSSNAAAFGIAPHLNSAGASLPISRSGSRMGMHSAGRSLFVGNLPFQCQWQDLKDLFRQIGPVVRADVALGPDGRSRGFGTVLFQSEVDADRAVKTLNGFEYNGRMIKVHHDRFTQTTNGGSTGSSISPPLYPAYAPNVHVPSHVHLQHQSTGTSGVGAPFLSQPTSPFEGFLTPMQALARERWMSQYLGQPVLTRSVTEQGLVGSGAGREGLVGVGRVAENLAVLQKEVLAKQVEALQLQQQAQLAASLGGGSSRPSLSQAPSVVGSRPSTSHAGSTRPASAMSVSSTRDVKLDYPSLLNPPPAPTPPTEAGLAAALAAKQQLQSSSSEEVPHTPLMNRQPSSDSPSSNHPGTIALPPPPSNFAGGGIMFSPLGRGSLPPMTPSMPGFTFHPQQVGTPPGMIPHFLSPGMGPASPQGYARQGSFSMMYSTPPMIHTPHHPYMMLTPGPRLVDSPGASVSVVGYPLSPGHHPYAHYGQQQWAEGVATPYASANAGAGGGDYFRQGVVGAGGTGSQEGGYFPPVEGDEESVSMGGEGSGSTLAEEGGSGSGGTQTQVLQNAPVISETTKPAATRGQSDAASTIRARVAGMTLDEKSMVNEIAVASGLGMGTAKQVMNLNGGVQQNGGGVGPGKLPGLWMSQKGRFTRSNAPSPLGGSSPEQEFVLGGNGRTTSSSGAMPPKLSERELMSGAGLGLPSPGRRASWAAEPGARRPDVGFGVGVDSDSR